MGMVVIAVVMVMMDMIVSLMGVAVDMVMGMRMGMTVMGVLMGMSMGVFVIQMHNHHSFQSVYLVLIIAKNHWVVTTKIHKNAEKQPIDITFQPSIIIVTFSIGGLSVKKILLIGDSIRVGYDSYVKEFLKDTCETYFPAENCRFAQYILRHLSDWQESLGLDENLDLIHWNCGLWDTVEQYGDGCLTPPEFYAHYIDRVCKRIKVLFPKATAIFATSTPILEGGYEEPSIFYRSNETIRQYNEIAKEIVLKHGFLINDLYAVVENVPKEYYSDVTHLYTPEGTQLMVNAVVKSICNALDMEQKEFLLTDYQAVTEIIGK